MLAKVNSGAVVGLESVPILVEVDVSSKSLPSFQIVGLGDKAVEESKERVRSAIKNSDLDFPKHKITVNLAPADLPKEGALYDLPIAVGILIANGSVALEIKDALFLGELSLDGSLRSTPGVLPLALLAKDLGIKKIFLPEVNAKEAAIISGIEAYPVPDLKTLVNHFLKISPVEPLPKQAIIIAEEEDFEFDFADIKGQEMAKRAMEISAAGGHNILLRGTPGSGKTLLARTYVSILPRMTENEAIEISKIYSVSGLLKAGESLVVKRPFRSPHHTTSHIGLVGGGAHPKPGEISLAHRGVLFLDELPEFPRHVLEALRQPLEDGFVTVSRAIGTSRFPARFTLVSACNPCPCGFSGSLTKACICTAYQINSYKKRLSGPLLDRIDLHVYCQNIPAEKLADRSSGESSKAVKTRVQAARDLQNTRFASLKFATNSEIPPKEIKNFCVIDQLSTDLLRQAVTSLNLSGRGFHRVLKVARTIADLAGSKEIAFDHVSEALQYRQKD